MITVIWCVGAFYAGATFALVLVGIFRRAPEPAVDNTLAQVNEAYRLGVIAGRTNLLFDLNNAVHTLEVDEELRQMVEGEAP